VRPIAQDPAAAELARRAFEGQTPVVVTRSSESSLDLQLWPPLDPSANEGLDRISAIPIISEQGIVKGVLQLGESLAHEPERPCVLDTSGLSILLGQTGAAIRNVELIESLRGLFEGVVELTVQAIDEKSPYTGDHCRRVPILTELIADAACETDTGPLKDFTLSEAQRYELRIAALLHDCGKVATPVHVMDKATKLEKLQDRIDLVEVRAEILRRDFETTALRQQLKCRDDDASSTLLRGREHAMLDEDLAFIRKYNTGGEFMPPEFQQRVEEIQQRYEWIDWKGKSRSLLTDDEVTNLQISHGTLNQEEREIIDRHIVTTIKLLEQLPFPPELQGVPAIAGGHHEHVDGTGFPKQLGQEQLSMTARILGLADVFEALTARDRPYKPGKTLSQTLHILSSMVGDRHIDADLYAALLEKNVHLRYAAEYMEPDQIDEVYQADVEALTAPWNAQSSDGRST
jgi:HD-GYP domain-containing protein (c-di-GMP phosphodiesterase class II)